MTTAVVLQSFGDKVNLANGAVKAFTIQDLDKSLSEPLESPCKKNNSPLKGIRSTLEKLILKINQYDTIGKIFGGGDPQRTQYIDNLLNIASGDIAGYLKTIFQSVRSKIFNFISDQTKKVLPFLFPSEIPNFTKIVNQANNLVSCLFNKLIRGLFKLVKEFLKNILSTLINAALCFVENFILDFLKKTGILDQITNVVQQALSLFSAAVSIIKGVGDLLLNAVDFISGIINFFKCDDDYDCPQVDAINLKGDKIGGIGGVPGTTVLPDTDAPISPTNPITPDIAVTGTIV